jgi:CDP-diacylglycerol---glycerol-3-phosphate 3-phosphatidyltransferase
MLASPVVQSIRWAVAEGDPPVDRISVLSSDKARNSFRHVTEPAGHALAKAGFTANSLTVIGLAGSVGAGILIASGYARVGGLLSLLSGLPDMLDGAVAKATGRSSRRGAFLDSVVDRLSDAAVLAGIVWLGISRNEPRVAVLAAMVMALSLIVSYVKARAESLGYECNVGIAERPERVVVLGVALLVGHVLAGLWVLVIAAAITLVQRIMRVWQQPDVEPDIGR